MPPAQAARHRALANQYPAVAAVRLPDGCVILSARLEDGRVAHVEVLDREGRQLDHDAIVRVLGSARQQALTTAEQATTHLIDHLAIRQAGGGDLNMSAIARDTGVARQTLYNRLEDAQIAPQGQPPAPAGAAAA